MSSSACLSSVFCAHLPGLSSREGANSPRAALRQPGAWSRRSAPSAPVGHPQPWAQRWASPQPPHHGVLSPTDLHSLFCMVNSGGARHQLLTVSPRSQVNSQPWQTRAVCLPSCLPPTMCHAGHPPGGGYKEQLPFLKLVT